LIINDQQLRLVAWAGGPQRDPFGRKIEVEEIDPHGRLLRPRRRPSAPSLRPAAVPEPGRQEQGAARAAVGITSPGCGGGMLSAPIEALRIRDGFAGGSPRSIAST
jgi:hypothetical protein